MSDGPVTPETPSRSKGLGGWIKDRLPSKERGPQPGDLYVRHEITRSGTHELSPISQESYGLYVVDGPSSHKGCTDMTQIYTMQLSKLPGKDQKKRRRACLFEEIGRKSPMPAWELGRGGYNSDGKNCPVVLGGDEKARTFSTTVYSKVAGDNPQAIQGVLDFIFADLDGQATGYPDDDRVRQKLTELVDTRVAPNHPLIAGEIKARLSA